MAGPLFYFGLALAGCITAGAVYFLLFGERGSEFGSTLTAKRKNKGGHLSWQAKPVLLKSTADIDPWTIALTGSEIRPLGARKSELEAGPQFAVEPILEREGPFQALDSLPSALKRPLRHTNPFARPGQKVQLKQVVPFELGEGEALLHQALFEIPLVCSGYLFVTDRRVMASYLRTQWQVWPLKLKRIPKRHQIRLKNIKKVGIFEARRPVFLIVAVTVCWWIPWGLLAAAVAVSGYFFLPRQELSISARDGMYRTYPVRKLNVLLVTLGRLLREDK